MVSNTLTKKSFMKQFIPIYLLMLPGILLLLIFNYIPMGGIFIAFKDVSPFEGLKGMFTAPWVGFANFTKFFNSYYFWNLLGNTLSISVKKLVVTFPASIILALLLNELVHEKFKKVVQTVSYMPHFISMVILTGLMTSMLTTNGGLVNQAIIALGGKSIFFLGDPKYFQGVLVFSSAWKDVGWNSIIYLAAITSVDVAQHEAAIIDGANRFKRALYITLPAISNIIIIMLILSIGKLMNAGFEQILLLYSPSVYQVGDIIDTYVYREGVTKLAYSYTTAVGLFKSVISLILVGGTNKLSKKFGQDAIW
jgi:putative aldouronate transport system permease protein